VFPAQVSDSGGGKFALYENVHWRVSFFYKEAHVLKPFGSYGVCLMYKNLHRGVRSYQKTSPPLVHVFDKPDLIYYSFLQGAKKELLNWEKTIFIFII
jgi:hypothetical protein